MKLNDTRCRNTKPKSKIIKLSDGDGLYLIVNPSGSKVWHFYYSFAKKRQTISFGRYPEIGLADARNMRQKARTQLAMGQNPSSIKKAQKLSLETNAHNTFEQVALRWKDVKSTKVSAKTMKTAWQRLILYVFPAIGQRPILSQKLGHNYYYKKLYLPSAPPYFVRQQLIKTLHMPLRKSSNYFIST